MTKSVSKYVRLSPRVVSGIISYSYRSQFTNGLENLLRYADETVEEALSSLKGVFTNEEWHTMFMALRPVVPYDTLSKTFLRMELEHKEERNGTATMYHADINALSTKIGKLTKAQILAVWRRIKAVPKDSYPMPAWFEF